jgi:BRCA1-associated protein
MNTFLKTNHEIALEKDFFRIWDYSRDLYIHKVGMEAESSQAGTNKTDPGFNSEANPNSKSHSARIISDIESQELLDASLQSQEYYFEKQIHDLNTTKNARIILIEQNFSKILSQKEAAIKKLKEIEDQKKLFETRKNELQKQIEGLANLQNELLRENKERQKQQEEFKKIFQETQNQTLVTEDQKELRIKELEEEIRDLSIYIEASRQLKSATLNDSLNSGDKITIKEPTIKCTIQTKPSPAKSLPNPKLNKNSPQSSPKKGKGKKGKK